MIASSSSTPMPSAWASRKVSSVGILLPRSSVKRASASAPTTRRLSRSTIGCSATLRPSPSIRRARRRSSCSRRRRSRLTTSSSRRARSSSISSPLAELVLELAQPVGDGDEADHQADGGDGELAGAQREARPPRARVRLGGEQVGERVQAGQAHQGDHADLAPGRRALGLPPPRRGDRELGDGEHADERAHGRVVGAVGADEGAERRRGRATRRPAGRCRRRRTRAARAAARGRRRGRGRRRRAARRARSRTARRSCRRPGRRARRRRRSTAARRAP